MSENELLDVQTKPDRLGISLDLINSGIKHFSLAVLDEMEKKVQDEYLEELLKLNKELLKLKLRLIKFKSRIQ